MKRLFIILSFILISILGFSQATIVVDLRIANATTEFGVNMSIASKVFDIATGNYWVATAGVISTATLTTASGSFTQLNAGTAAQDLSWNNGTHAIDISGGGSSAVVPLATNAVTGLATAAQITALEANTDKVSNVSTDLSIGTRTATTMDVNSSDGDNATLLAATTTQAGLMTDTQFDKLAAIAAGAEVNINADWDASSGDAEILNKPTIYTSSGSANAIQLSDGSDGFTTDADLTFDGENLDVVGDVKAKTFTSVVLNGAKTANFTHDAVAASRGAYRVNLADLTLSIHNLNNGMSGVVKLNYHTTTVTSLTVNFYSDAGSTQYNSTTHVILLGNDAASEVDKRTAVYYECDNDGTNTTVTVVYGQE